MWALLLGFALQPFSVNGAFRAPAGPSPSEKVKHLLLDISESVQKASEDADLTFATLDTYNQQLELSLQNEIGALNQTLLKLSTVQGKYRNEIASSEGELKHLNSAVEGSTQIATSYEKGTAKVGKKFDGLLVSVKALIALLQNAVITPDGTLVTPEEPDAHGQPSKVFNAIRRLLSAHAKSLQDKYGDILKSFSATSFIQVQNPLAHDFETVRMTPKMLSRTVAALQWVQNSLHDRKDQALGQFESREQKYESDATATSANLDAQQGVQAENERKSEELSFSVGFTKVVLQKDQEFLNMVTQTARAKKKLVDEIGALRSKEKTTIKNLVDILSGKFKVANAPTLAPLPVAVAPKSHQDWLWNKHDNSRPPSFMDISFVQVRSHTKPKISNLQTQIETALHNKEDTHALLMKIKAQLDSSAASTMDADNVRDVMTSLQDVLKQTLNEQSRAEEAKRKCDSQMYRAREEEQGLKANVALMSTARDHTSAAIKAAKSNLQGISKKIEALKKSGTDFTQINAQSLHTLEEQGRDRSTIMVAVNKAAEVAERALPSDQAPAIVLLKQLAKQFTEQEQKERAYREQQGAFKGAFLQYVEDYVQLLKDRENHYEDALAALELYSDEISTDEVGQKDSLTSADELKQENVDLCDSILKFYDHHTKRRMELVQTLKKILPKVPEILNMESR
jgi:hypothetical protein